MKFKDQDRWTRDQRENYNYIRISNRSGPHIGCVRITGEGKAHFLKKAEICWKLHKDKITYVTEAIFNNGSRADVVDFKNGIIYEIMDTESDQSIEKKKIDYPHGFNIVKIRVD